MHATMMPYQQPTTTTDSILESMSPEIQLAIPSKMPDIATLHALIDASSTYNIIFTTNSSSCLTKTTLHELPPLARTPDFSTSPPLWEVVLIGRDVHPELEPTLTRIAAASAASD